MTNAPASLANSPTHLPDIALPDSFDEAFNINSLKGKWVFIYFYPKAMTSGCTVQSIAMNALQARAPAGGLQVVGISPDAPKANRKFAERDNLSIPLLSDTEHHAATLFGVWAEKSMYGKKYMGIIRSTFVFNPQGELVATMNQKSTDEQLAAVTEFYENSIK